MSRLTERYIVSVRVRREETQKVAGLVKRAVSLPFTENPIFVMPAGVKKKSRGTCNIREQRHARHSFLTDWRDLGENIDGFETIELVSRRFLLARRFSSLKKRQRLVNIHGIQLIGNIGELVIGADENAILGTSLDR